MGLLLLSFWNIINGTFCSYSDLVQTSLARAKQLETLNAFTFLNEDQVLHDAKEADKRHLVTFYYNINPLRQCDTLW